MLGIKITTRIMQGQNSAPNSVDLLRGQVLKPDVVHELFRGAIYMFESLVDGDVVASFVVCTGKAVPGETMGHLL
jgi:hypothetical protein